ncbi:TPA: hypothetical protein ACN359_002091 [Vibrio parahaemolyticus]|uniref:hypothetical protein n=1 Tax=Vibrio parahaemolyticus TaxID=670 RepID=UPI0015872201|nr:hypothetical protein [Vibrio parahaemolyticus]EHK6508508.1 hypothetical protein [Vibrio parahaemolyticus]EID0056659.1 hypothetical protein [Vibrio parahaemolyticus]ELK3867040.1 hypothetical protein [Vibrio parahaemolyticus]ELZ1477473.1 hypothetical protein [Vibrio parahaemolyticus]
MVKREFADWYYKKHVEMSDQWLNTIQKGSPKVALGYLAEANNYLKAHKKATKE